MTASNAAETMIEAENLTKVYGNFTAIKDVSFACRPGEIVGFLGPNGAGKTTTMRILTGFMPPTSGVAFIAGYDTVAESFQARQHLGYLPETVPLYPEMTVENYLAFVGRLRRVPDLWERVDDVLEDVALLDRAESYVGSLSKGMRQRLGLAQAMIHRPDVLILDEPTIGLDPQQIVDMRLLIRELGQKHTILLSTHIMSEVEQICDRVIMIFDGAIALDQPLKTLTGGDGEQAVILKLAAPHTDVVTRLGAVPGVASAAASADNEFRLVFDGRDETRTAIANEAVQAEWGLLGLREEKPSLETTFLRKMRESQAVALVYDAPASEGEEE